MMAIASHLSAAKLEARCHPKAAGEEDRDALKKLQDIAAEEELKHPEAIIEIWAMDEHF